LKDRTLAFRLLHLTLRFLFRQLLFSVSLLLLLRHQPLRNFQRGGLLFQPLSSVKRLLFLLHRVGAQPRRPTFSAATYAPASWAVQFFFFSSGRFF
jgi:hypothetical protein